MSKDLVDETQEAMTMLKTVIEFEPATDKIVRDESGNYHAGKTEPFIKLGIGFRDELAACKGAPLAVFLSICLHVNEHGRSWPSIKTICQETGYETEAVTKAVNTLKDAGLIRVTPRRGFSHLYEPLLAAYGRGKVKSMGTQVKGGTRKTERPSPGKTGGVLPRKTETEEEPLKENQEERTNGADAHALAPSGIRSEATSPRAARDPFAIQADFDALAAAGRARGADRTVAAHPLAGRWPHLVDLARAFEDANGTRLADLPKSQVVLWAKQLEGHYQAALTPDDERELVRMAKAKKWDLYSPGSADKLIGHLRRHSPTLAEPTYAKPSF
jgi:hypothetical protein